MKIGSSQRPISNVPTESNVVNENKTDSRKSSGNKAVDTMTDARVDGFAADGKITMGQRFQTKSSAVNVIRDGALTDDE